MTDSMGDKTDQALEEELIQAAMAWHSAKLYRVATQGSPSGMEAEGRCFEADRALTLATVRVTVRRASRTIDEEQKELALQIKEPS